VTLAWAATGRFRCGRQEQTYACQGGASQASVAAQVRPLQSKQTEFGRWLRDNIADRVDTSRGTPDDAAAAVAAWALSHLT
jgi:hypothetical protein